LRRSLELLAATALVAPAAVRAADHRRRDCEGLGTLGVQSEELEVKSSDGTRLFVRSCGSGDRTVFFAHGWTCNESVFRFQQRLFSNDYRIVTFDQRGHGRSEMPESLDYCTERQAEDLRAVVEAVGPERFVVAGHSMGGFAAFKFFERFGGEYEGRLRGLAIIDSTGTDLMEGIVFGRVLRRLPKEMVDRVLIFLARHNGLATIAAGILKDSALAYLVVRWAAFGKRPFGEHVEHLREMVTATPLTSVFFAAKACADFHCDYSLPAVSVPVALLVGDRDKLTNLESNLRTARLVPDARLKVYPNAGHCTLLERREEFNADLGGFLREVFDGAVAPGDRENGSRVQGDER
jgi:pimeloyl-ACP methyl ester carboxylesterase